MKIVHVEWVDSSGFDGVWHSPDGAFEPVLCVSVGFLLRKTRKHLVLCMSRTPGQVALPFSIPRSAVTKVVRLRAP